MPLWSVFALLAGVGALVAAASALVLRSTGADSRTARRLAGARQFRVGQLLTAAQLPERPIRVVGRIRCQDPLEPAAGERLVAYHRDVEVRLPRIGWRSIERVRETRSFDLWDHGGSLPVDPSRSAEPLVTIPSVWRGDPSELGEPHVSSVRRLEERYGKAAEARAITRAISVTDRLLVVARAARGADGVLRLEPSGRGYIISSLVLDDAMRLLGGRHPRLMVASVIGVGVGCVMAVAGLAGMLVAALLGS